MALGLLATQLPFLPLALFRQPILCGDDGGVFLARRFDRLADRRVPGLGQREGWALEACGRADMQRTRTHKKAGFVGAAMGFVDAVGGPERTVSCGPTAAPAKVRGGAVAAPCGSPDITG